jgi:hypothetical protein
MSVLRGLAGEEDFAFGLGTEHRMEGFGRKAVRTQIQARHFPILDALQKFDLADVEGALEECWTVVYQMLVDAADALYDGGYITDKESFIDDILDEASDVAEDINDDTDEGGYDGGSDIGDTPTPVTDGVIYVRYPARVRPSTRAILWVEGVGGLAPYTWEILANNTGATLTAQGDTSRVLYTAGTVEASDTIKVTDANGLTATCIIEIASDAPVITIYGATTAVVNGPAVALHATGGATPYTWDLYADVTGGSLTANSGYFVGQGSCDYYPGTIAGTDTVRVTELNGSVDLHDIVVSATDPAHPNPQIHGATWCRVRGASDPNSADVSTDEDYVLLLQCVGGEGMIDWEISDDNSGASIYPKVSLPVDGKDLGDARSPAAVEASWYRSRPREAGPPWEEGACLMNLAYSVANEDALETVCTTIGAEIVKWIGDDIGVSFPWVHIRTTTGQTTEDLIDALDDHYTTEWITPNYRRYRAGSTPIYMSGDASDTTDSALAVEVIAVYVAGTTSGVTDTVKVTDTNGMTDEHTISVLAEATTTEPEIYGWTECVENGELILKVYGGTPPYDWEIPTNNSGSQMFETEEDEDGQNRYKAGSTADVSDTVRVTDANGKTDEHTISVYDSSESGDHDDDNPYSWPPYWNDDTGYLQVNIAPQEAITDGAQWRVNGGTWMDSGERVDGLDVGDAAYVEFKAIDNWTIPDPQTVTIVAGANVVSGTYEQAAGVIASFTVSCDRDYYPGRVLRLTITPKDSEGNQVFVAETDIIITSSAEGLDLYGSGTCQRTDATESLETTIGGGGTYYKDVAWWGETPFDDPMTITVKLADDESITGSVQVDLDAATLALTDTGSGQYINETKYEHLSVAVKDSGGATCAEFDGDVLLSPSEGEISLDGVTYGASATLSITNGSGSTDLYLKSCSGDVTITAVLVDDTSLTDTADLEEVPITFEFGGAWDAANKTGLISDATAFEITITAKRGNDTVTTFAEACTVTPDSGTPSNNTIAAGDWSNGEVTLASLTIDWDGTPSEIVLTCADDAAGTKTGTRTVKTDNATASTTENMTIKIARKYATSASKATAELAFDDAKTKYDGSPSYGAIVYYADKNEKHWGDTYGEYCRFDYGVSLLHVALTSFGDDEQLFLELTFDNPAKAAAVWSQADLYIVQPPTSSDYTAATDEAQWEAGVDLTTLRLIDESVIVNSGTILVDLNMTKADFTPGIPMQVFIRPAVSTAWGAYVSDSTKNTRYYPASAKLKGY